MRFVDAFCEIYALKKLCTTSPTHSSLMHFDNAFKNLSKRHKEIKKKEKMAEAITIQKQTLVKYNNTNNNNMDFRRSLVYFYFHSMVHMFSFRDLPSNCLYFLQ